MSVEKILAVTVPLSTTTIICSLIAWLFFWGHELRQERMMMETLRTESCYTEYGFSEAHQQNWIKLEYCGEEK